jgi:hypothetical protein
MPDQGELQLTLDLDAAPEAELPARLRRLGLPERVEVTLTRNRTVLVSYSAATGLRLHAGYAWAGDDVLAAIITFLKPRATRAERLAARRRFLRFPVDRHVQSRQRRRPAPAPEDHTPLVERLNRLHEILNERHFGGRLSSVEITLSERMQTRLGEYISRGEGLPGRIAVSYRHLRRHGWAAVTETLLHEMVHQWQDETGMPIDHGPEFRRKARQVGITPAATVAASQLLVRGSERRIA